MSTAEADELALVLDNVRSWPVERRLALAQGILRTLESDLTGASRPRRSPEILVGLLKTDQPPPSDEDCQRILEEELIRKHLK
jgi:hypothetical protein